MRGGRVPVGVGRCDDGDVRDALHVDSAGFKAWIQSQSLFQLMGKGADAWERNSGSIGGP